MNSGVAQEALPQDGSHGKHRKTQVKAVVWQVTGVGQAPHAGDRFRGRDLGRANGILHTNLSSKKNRDRTLSLQRRQRSPSPQDDLGFDPESREESEQPGDSCDVCRLDQGGQIFIHSSATDLLTALASSCFCYLPSSYHSNACNLYSFFQHLMDLEMTTEVQRH